MEMYARWAHRVWWHEMPSGWALHKSHHSPRTSTFEANDIYAVANAAPAFALCFYGFFHSGIVGSLAFGMGLGITLFGIAYMFVHDGLVHKRFPVCLYFHCSLRDGFAGRSFGKPPIYEKGRGGSHDSSF